MPENDIGQDRFQARLTKELRIKGSMPAPVLAPEIVPVIIVEDDRVENQFLARERRFGCTLTLAGVVNEYYYFQLWNPVGGNGLIVIEEFGCADWTAAAGMDFGYAQAAVSASLAARDKFCLDSRLPGVNPRAGTGTCLVGTDLAIGFLDVYGRTHMQPNVMRSVRLKSVLSPGHGFGMQCVTVNQGIAGYIIWRERQAMDGELT